MKVSFSFALLALVLLFTGCTEPQPPVLIPSGKTETITLKANFTDEISKDPVILSDVKRAVIKTIREASKYKTFYSHFADGSSSCIYPDGVKVEFFVDNLEILYVSGFACGYDKDELDKQLIRYFGARIPYKTVGTQDKFDITFMYPKDFIQRFNGHSGEPIRFDTLSNLRRDFDNVFQSLKNLSITREYMFEGEEISKYNKDSTIDSLRYANLDNAGQTIEYWVFNYQNGSKVTYEATVNYIISHDNEIDIGKDIVSKIKQKIKKTINE